MKLLNTLTALSILGLTSFANAADTSSKTCDKGAKKATACASECSKYDCDMELVNTKTFIVTGMTCTSCSNKVKTTLAAVEGVSVKKVCHKSGKVMVKFDEAKTDQSKVMTAISSTGFKVAGEQLNIPVSGMTCGVSSKKLATALTSLEGCTGVGVCHTSGQASVVIDTAKTSEAKVMEAINANGFKVTKEAKAAPATETTKVKS
ncbi:MAG: copper ion binding protein [Rubritalea sp.]|jgi:copper ion binding protein